MKFDLARMRTVMAAVGGPHHRFPSIHIAGTNGKGSVTAMIATALGSAGYRVGMYTSPHLENINERFQINGRQISDRDLDRLARSLIRRFPHLTQFEFLTAIAFVWLAEQNIDVAVVETGLGGRLDATNVLRRVFATVITNIDYDHMNWLGRTLPKIAAEKAGIIKPGVPLVTGATGAALAVIESAARANHASVTSVRPNASSPAHRLEGEHQRHNAAVAAQTLRTVRPLFPGLMEKNIRQALNDVRWPGRFERFLVGSGVRQRTVVLDGAHNAAGCRALARTLRARRLAPVHLLVGALRDKDIPSMAKTLATIASDVVAARVPSDRSADPAFIARLPAWRSKATSAASIDAGWKKVLSAGDRRPVVVAGSLYLVGEIRRKLR